ncbi:ABC-2 transporter permease [Paenibacillus sp. 1001270B_150601_E10]|uniref:ABC-2 transporter permease n=1 Tax=Paenibacillus sp. 1001270B_150601_E10 TaxID=2787079 RepID=UPI00189FE322|nr:ABC-2 transporter permease [Paenibacillus sp. 1001270B_150601_E10]
MWRKAFDPGLWFKEYRQVRVMLWAMLGLGFATLPLYNMNRWWFGEQRLIDNTVESIVMNPGYDPWMDAVMNIQVLMLVLGTILALWQMGFERRSNMQEFTLSLPYSRTHIYTTKWLLGAAFLIGCFLFSAALDAIVLATSQLAPFIEWGGYVMTLLRAMLINLTLYTLMLAMGTVCGSVFSQISFLAVLALLPEFIRLMVMRFCWAFDISTLKKETTLEGDVYYSSIVPNIHRPEQYLFNDVRGADGDIGFWTISIALTVTLFVVGLLLFKHNKAENNGKLVILPSFEVILRVGFTLCFALLGATVSTGVFTNSPAAYCIGFLAALFIGYFIIRWLTNVKLKI